MGFLATLFFDEAADEDGTIDDGDTGNNDEENAGKNACEVDCPNALLCRLKGDVANACGEVATAASEGRGTI